ncbi:hypothetical protein [Vibrio renipiscarius]|uniref:Uncharacterized protein n=1 Tax=Vibrio renipiscarius TaxID=1461322 RepID=A0A0C2JBN9_9VIBR|nr:hypothetical protein [Vibrio renipiscarius]KII75314.1 hypothetical protein OJ16_18655 [Vibrio renipiscarius]KII78766.1 hypothetical protein PL18_10765 [Vibrio renipiscarius]
MSTALVLGRDSGYYGDGSVDPSNQPREIQAGQGASTNFRMVDGAGFYVNGLDETKAGELMQRVVDAGGNTVRWWAHTNLTKTLAWDGGLVSCGASQANIIAGMKSALLLLKMSALR